MSSTSIEFGRRLKKLRLEKRLTQKELASPYYTHAHISTIEAGRRQPSEQALRHFADKLGVDIEQLVTGRPPGLNARLRLQLELARQGISNGELDQARRSIQAVAAQAKTFLLIRVLARSLEFRGLLEERGSHFELAIKRYEEAAKILIEEAATARSYATAGKVRSLLGLGDVHHAIYVGEAYIEELRRLQMASPDSVVKVLSPLILCYHSAGAHWKADEAAQECLKLAPRVNNPEALATMYVNAARAQIEQSQFLDADASLTKAQELFEELEFRTEVGVVNLARGAAQSRRGELTGAREHLQIAVSAMRETSNETECANALMELGRVERLEGQIDVGVRYVKESIEMMGPEAPAWLLAWAHRELGYLRQTDDPVVAEKEALRAIDLYNEAGQPIEAARTHLFVCQLRGSQGDLAAALSHAEAATAALEEAPDL